MRNFIIVLLVLVPVLLLFPQEKNTNLAVSPLSDSLTEYLLKNPLTRDIREKLIRDYLSHDEPELANLEFLDFTAKDTLTDDLLFQKSIMYLKMERFSASLKVMVTSYLQKPGQEKLKYIALLAHCLQKDDLARGLYEKLKLQNPQFSYDLYMLFQSAYSANRKLLSEKIITFLRDFDNKEYNRLFPNPIVSFISPEDNYLTEETELTGIINIQHGKAIKSVELNGKPVFQKNINDSLNATAKRTISVPLHLIEGENRFEITVTDVFGYAGHASLAVNCLNFKKKAEWASGASDSLLYRFRYLKSFVSEDILHSRVFDRYRLLLFSYSPDADSMDYFRNGIFWNELLTNNFSGFLSPDNVKLLLGDRVNEENMKMLFTRWLIKNITLQTVPVVYLAGKWDIRDGKWLLKNNKGTIDIKPVFKSLLSVASSGVVFIIDGSIINKETLQKELNDLVSGSGIGVDILLNSDNDLSYQITNLLTNPDSLSADSSNVTLMAGNMGNLLKGLTVFSNNRGNTPFLNNPAAIIVSNHASLMSRLNNKMKTDRVTSSRKTKVISFLTDWRRYRELVRYLNNELSLGDLLSQIDEFDSRKKHEGKE